MSANPYNPVTTTDTTHLADDDWGLNLPNIEYKKYEPSRLKSVCNFFRERSRLFLIIGCILIFGIIVISIIAVATRSSPGRTPTDKDKERRWSSPKEGMVFYPVPVDGSTIITFSTTEPSNSPLFQSLKNVTAEYKEYEQHGDVYTHCTKDNNPADKVCKLSNIYFGDLCTEHRSWGYTHAMPCIFLQLNMPDNVVVRPIPESSILWQVAELVMLQHNDSSYVPVHCDGSTKRDRAILGSKGYDKPDTHPIQYFPPDGFPSYFYRERNMTLPFIKPAMMVYLTSLRDNHLVHITCTVWGQVFDYDGNMLEHDLIRTHFAVIMNPKN